MTEAEKELLEAALEAVRCGHWLPGKRLDEAAAKVREEREPKPVWRVAEGPGHNIPPWRVDGDGQTVAYCPCKSDADRIVKLLNDSGTRL